MGTRSITIVKDGTVEIVKMYRQMDGYPTGHGADLKEFVGNRPVGNGINSQLENAKGFNGMGCMAAALVAHFKERIGDIYLVGSMGCGEEYVYTLTCEDPGMGGDFKYINLEVMGKELLYSGPIKNFDPEKCEKSEL